MVESPEVVIRKAEPSDAGPLAELAARTFRDTFAADSRPEDMATHLALAYGPGQQLAEITAPGACTLLAESIGPIAFAQLRPGATPACVTSDDPVELQRFYVDQAWHGLGVAQRLMQAALAEAAMMGARSVWLGVSKRNLRAKAFYRKCGFVDVGSYEFRLGQDVQTDRLMVLSLRPD